MSNQELAQGLIELWGDYMASTNRTFQPTMTDFIQWLREYEISESKQEVKEGRTSQAFDYIRDQDGNAVITPFTNTVKVRPPAEASVAEYTGGADQKSKIRELYREGYSAARIRHMLKLNVTLAQIYAIGKRR